MTALVVRGDARCLPLPDSSVDLIVTSPPYFALRSYSDGGEHYPGQIGSEATPAEFLDALWACTREWMRVLKPSGSIFVNLGDKYAGGGNGPQGATGQRLGRSSADEPFRAHAATRGQGARDKSLMCLPWRYIDHFAAFPTEWPRRLILGWSPPGLCVACGEGRRPVTHKDLDIDHMRGGNRPGFIDATEPNGNGRGLNAAYRPSGRTVATITGYVCACPDTTAPTRPAVVLDPFGGTGTTALVAKALGRVGVTVDLSYDYCRIARWRTSDRGQLAKALRVEKPPTQTTGQYSLFDDG